MDIFRWLRHQWDRTAAAVIAAGGLLALFLGWLGLSGVELPSEQIPYLASGGLVGLFALGVSATLWLSADLHDEWRQLHNIEDKLDQLCQIARERDSGAEQADDIPVGAVVESANEPSAQQRQTTRRAQLLRARATTPDEPAGRNGKASPRPDVRAPRVGR
jgi:hypothetical protein